MAEQWNALSMDIFRIKKKSWKILILVRAIWSYSSGKLVFNGYCNCSMNNLGDIAKVIGFGEDWLEMKLFASLKESHEFNVVDGVRWGIVEVALRSCELYKNSLRFGFEKFIGEFCFLLIELLKERFELSDDLKHSLGISNWFNDAKGWFEDDCFIGWIRSLLVEFLVENWLDEAFGRDFWSNDSIDENILSFIKMNDFKFAVNSIINAFILVGFNFTYISCRRKIIGRFLNLF